MLPCKSSAVTSWLVDHYQYSRLFNHTGEIPTHILLSMSYLDDSRLQVESAHMAARQRQSSPSIEIFTPTGLRPQPTRGGRVEPFSDWFRWPPSPYHSYTISGFQLMSTFFLVEKRGLEPIVHIYDSKYQFY